MKTIKIKVKLNDTQLQQFQQWCSESDWIWNFGLVYLLKHHHEFWYSWAAKKGVNLDGVIPVPIFIGKRSAYMGVSCQIAIGDFQRWEKMDNAPKDQWIVCRKSKADKDGNPVYGAKPPYKLVSKGEYIQLPPQDYEDSFYLNAGIKAFSGLKSAERLNTYRAIEELPPLSIPAKFMQNVLDLLEKSWKSFLDVKNINAKRPRWKGVEIKTSSVGFNQPECVRNFSGDHVSITGFDLLSVIYKGWQDRVADCKPTSGTLVKQPSGFYLCLVMRTQIEEAIAKLKNEIKTVTKRTGYVKGTDEYKEELRRIQRDIDRIQTAESVVAQEARKSTGLSAGVDPGVVNVLTLDNGAAFRPNRSRERTAERIARLQRRFDQIYKRHQKELEQAGGTGQHPMTKNELKLKAKISRLHELGRNQSNAFNHKLSTRLDRTYDQIAWEDTQLLNMLKQIKDGTIDERGQFVQNGRAAKRGLIRSIASRSIGDLKAKTATKMKATGRTLIDAPARNTSQHCHACSTKGDRRTQAEFYCLNNLCVLFGALQNADTNAAKNIKKYCTII